MHLNPVVVRTYSGKMILRLIISSCLTVLQPDAKSVLKPDKHIVVNGVACAEIFNSRSFKDSV